MTVSEGILSGAPIAVKTADQATAQEMLTNAGFRDCVTARQKNEYKPHDSEEANKEAKARVVALSRLLIEG